MCVNRKGPVKPSWVPDDCAWVHPTKRKQVNEPMDPPTFLKNERRVLRAAYVHAGYDVDSHTSGEFCLGKGDSKEEPLRIPLYAQKPYAPPAVVISAVDDF